MRILIAEDDVTSRAAIVGVLKKNGYETVEAVNGVLAMEEFLNPDAPRLGIIDWVMPEMDGLEVVRRVREMQMEEPPYLIMLSSKDEKAEIIAGLKAGADDYLPKPFNPGELLARVEVGRRLVELRKELVKSRKNFEYQASHDGLTGLLNRRAILDLLHKEITRSGRKVNCLAVGMCDVDYFKKINDCYGHQTGDDILRGLAKILVGTLREYDSAGRIGGEEFLVVAPMKPETDHIAVFERLRDRVAAEAIETRSGGLSVTVSIGVALAGPGATVDNILEAADVALYLAKSQGRNRTVQIQRPAVTPVRRSSDGAPDMMPGRAVSRS